MLTKLLFAFSLLFLIVSENQETAETSFPKVQPQVNNDFKEQYKELTSQIEEKQEWFKRIESQTFNKQALVLPGDKDPLDVVLRRCETLVADLGKNVETHLRVDFGKLSEQIKNTEPGNARKRKQFFTELLTLRRKISFSNPLLNFDNIVFTVSNSSAGDFHMCDQYYGIFARPGGSIFMLDNAFSDQPELKDVLANSTVVNGRLKGRNLSGGMFLLPELSYDGKKILFSYSECGRDTDQPTPLEVES
ncbi:MAG: hypothetical protein HQ522_20195, partial [Bacteroidetes bacterium]|nr:hypothetical protein [Bacteroidota bacterium]